FYVDAVPSPHTILYPSRHCQAFLLLSRDLADLKEKFTTTKPVVWNHCARAQWARTLAHHTDQLVATPAPAPRTQPWSRQPAPAPGTQPWSRQPALAEGQF